MIVCVFERIHPFHIICQVYWHRVFKKFLCLRFNILRVCNDCTSLNFEIDNFSLFFFIVDYCSGAYQFYFFRKKNFMISFYPFHWLIWCNFLLGYCSSGFLEVYIYMTYCSLPSSNFMSLHA